MEPINESQPMCGLCGDFHEGGCHDDDFDGDDGDIGDALACLAELDYEAKHDEEGNLRPIPPPVPYDEEAARAEAIAGGYRFMTPEELADAMLK